jgi:hypothetical protein
VLPGTCLVRLVTDDGAPPTSVGNWPEVAPLISDLQPARSAWPEGFPPRGIRIGSRGGTGVAPPARGPELSDISVTTNGFGARPVAGRSVSCAAPSRGRCPPGRRPR